MKKIKPYSRLNEMLTISASFGSATINKTISVIVIALEINSINGFIPFPIIVLTSDKIVFPRSACDSSKPA